MKVKISYRQSHFLNLTFETLFCVRQITILFLIRYVPNFHWKKHSAKCTFKTGKNLKKMLVLISSFDTLNPRTCFSYLGYGEILRVTSTVIEVFSSFECYAFKNVQFITHRFCYKMFLLFIIKFKGFYINKCLFPWVL